MTTSHDIYLRRALFLACTALAALQYPCHAFSSYSLSVTRPSNARIGSQQQLLSSEGSRCAKLGLHGTATNEEEDRSRPNIVVIKSHEDYVKFLEEDDRLCVIKYYANWCKSCQRFGQKFRHLAFDEGDRIVGTEGDVVHSGKVRFAEVEYSANPKLCKLLKVKKLPTVHMHRKGSGKIVDMTCKPSLFHLVVDEMHRVMDDSVLAESSSDSELELETKKQAEVINATTTSGASFDRAMVAGSNLGDEILASLGKKKERDEEAPKKKTPWFTF